MKPIYVFCDKCRKRDKKIEGTNYGYCLCGGKFIDNRNDLTIINYTANRTPLGWRKYWTETLLKSADGYPIISVSHKPVDFADKNVVVGDIGCSSWNIYYQMLLGAKEATTPYVAMAEDDCLYSEHHFKFHRPKPDTFAYNLNKWSLFTWDNPAIFSLKRRKTACTLIAPRELLIETLEERIAKFPNKETYPRKWYGEPGRNDYERAMGVKLRKAEEVYSIVSCIVLSHPNSEDYLHVGVRKNHGQIKVKEICDWPKPEFIISKYK
jgi:hypothetical protein